MLTINPVTNHTNNQRLNFGQFLPRKIFSDIRDIPNMKCGCCGHDTFTSDETTAFIKSFLAGSKRALENSAMEKYRNSEAFTFIQGLSDIQPKQTVRNLISIPENQAKIKTLSGRTQLDINMIGLIADGITVKAPRVVQKFDKFREFFAPEDAEILKVMDFYALKYPKKTFSEIFNMPEVIEYHKGINETNKKYEQVGRIEVFKRLKEFGLKLSPNDRKALQSTNTDAIKILNNFSFQPHIKKELLYDLYENFAKQSEGKVRKKGLFKIIDDIPLIGFTPDEFIVNHVSNRKTDIDIVTYFARKLQATYEHFKARSKNGADVKENIIILCGKCNQERSNLPYPFFLRFHPEMLQNLQKQLNKIMMFIKHGKLTGYDNYPMDMKQNVLGESANLLRPKIGDYLNFRKELAAKKLERLEAKLAKKETKYNNACTKLDEINSRINEIEAQLRQLKKEKRVIKENYDATKDEVEQTRSRLEQQTILLDDREKELLIDRTTNANLQHKKRKIKKLRP